jgi:hypothetical protein
MAAKKLTRAGAVPPKGKAGSKQPRPAAAKPRAATRKKATAPLLAAERGREKVNSRNAKHPHARAIQALREYGLTFPETHLKSPWPGHLDLAVRDKTFAYLSVEGEPLKLSCKLPQSGSEALGLSFAEPTPYGLGKSGWVTAIFAEDAVPPIDFLKLWIEESYRAQAPKRLLKQLD